MRLLRDLTAGRFRDGAVARVLAMEFWTRGEAPTFEEFARSWTKAKAEEHRLLTPEYAYLTDLRHQRTDGDWKALRKAKAKSAWRRLRELLPFERPTAGCFGEIVRATRARRHEVTVVTARDCARVAAKTTVGVGGSHTWHRTNRLVRPQEQVLRPNGRFPSDHGPD